MSGTRIMNILNSELESELDVEWGKNSWEIMVFLI